MRRTLGCVVCSLLGCAAAAQASPVLVLDHGRVVHRQDRFLPSIADSPTPPPPAGQTLEASAAGAGVPATLMALAQSGAIAPDELNDRLATYSAARQALRRLHGPRRRELGAVISNLDAIAGSGALTASRLHPLFDTLEANRVWWTTGPQLHNGQRVLIAGSHLTYQYYAGQGIQVQVLANFGKANSILDQGIHDDEAAELLDELLPLGVDRSGALAWEYYFRFGGSGPLWTSGLSQGTAIQALVRAGTTLHNPLYLDAAHRGLQIFELPPPVGVRVATPAGAHYLIYSYAPDQRVINAFIQALNGLYDVATLANDAQARALFDAGNAEALLELPSYDTGDWSLYDQHSDSDVSYHRLLTNFLRGLCRRTGTPLYCDTAQRFAAELQHIPTRIKR
ncbi:MAG TPA: D-glucuronyl C5-epimerase family protein [Solirubrobacteraceae bacterium]|nr:D-glucuronyl C5-epimerase family protein [Solirubrobacteraceae bacterium]